MRPFGLALTLALLGAPAAAQTRPVVVELFTSEACSSCPPAEALLNTLKSTDSFILPLSFHVTYWDSPAWTDKYSLTGATERQSWYVGLQNSDTVFTPEAIIDGSAQLNGANRYRVTSAIADAKSSQPPAIPITITGTTMLTITVAAGTTAPANLWLFGYDPTHTTHIGGGENAGATITEANIVRSITPLGTWNGIAISYHMPHPAGANAAVLLQTTTGHILGAAADGK